MYKNGSDYTYSPSDLIGFLENDCVTWLDRYNLDFPGELTRDEPPKRRSSFKKAARSMKYEFSIRSVRKWM
jgi:hypothetical protein